MSTAQATRPRSRTSWGRVAAFVEAVVAAAFIVLNLLIPSLLVVALACLSLVVRRRGFASLGFHRVERPGRMAAQVLAVMVGWTLLQLAVFMPVLNHLTGEKQDLSGFADLEGSIGLLAAYLLASWTLAALAEETAFRGYLQARIVDVLGPGTPGVWVAVVVTSLLFGMIHSEQGLIGVLVVALDGLLFSWLRLHYRSLWAAVLAHGFNNSIGLTAFFLIGPVYGFW